MKTVKSYRSNFNDANGYLFCERRCEHTAVTPVIQLTLSPTLSLLPLLVLRLLSHTHTYNPFREYPHRATDATRAEEVRGRDWLRGDSIFLPLAQRLGQSAASAAPVGW